MRITPSVDLMILSFLFFYSTQVFANLVVQMNAEPTQFDPLMMEDGVAMRIAANVLGTPYEYDGAGNLKKALVEGVSVSRDRLTYTFLFKKNLKWSDGVSFKPDQFLLALNRIVNSKVKVALSELFPKIDLKHSLVLDSRRVQVVLFEKDALMLHWCSLPSFAPIREDMVAQYEKKRTPVMPSLGAYQVIEYQRDEFLNLKKNPHYYAKDEVVLNEVKIRFIKDEGALFPLFKAGSLDVLSKVPMLQLEQVKSVGSVAEVPVEAVTYLGFNTLKPPFNEIKNRKKLREAIADKTQELAVILKSGEKGADFFLPDLLWPPGFIRKLSKTTGSGEWIKDEKENIEFSIQSDPGSRNQTILEYVQSGLKKKYNWNVHLDLMEWASHYSKVKSDPDAVFRMGWQNPVSDPYVLYQVLRGKGANNFTGWSNSEYDALLVELREETRLVKKLEIVKKMETILEREVPVVPLLQQVLRFGYSKRVLGFRANSFGVILFRELRLNEKVN